jgi:hypothetical protein
MKGFREVPCSNVLQSLIRYTFEERKHTDAYSSAIQDFKNDYDGVTTGTIFWNRRVMPFNEILYNHLGRVGDGRSAVYSTVHEKLIDLHYISNYSDNSQFSSAEFEENRADFQKIANVLDDLLTIDFNDDEHFVSVDSKICKFISTFNKKTIDTMI